MENIILKGQLTFLTDASDKSFLIVTALMQQSMSISGEKTIVGHGDLNFHLWQLLNNGTLNPKCYFLDERKNLYDYGNVKITIEFEDNEE